MKIQFYRNTQSSTASIPSGTSAGEPIWFKDRLYIGSVGSTAGGTANTTAGTPIPVATKVTGESVLELSTSEQTYLNVDGTLYKIKLPTGLDADHNQTVKAGSTTFGADDAVEIVAGTNISVTPNSTNKTITIANTYSHPSDGSNVGTYGLTADATPAHGSGTFKVPYLTVNSAGHVTAAGEHTVTLPADKNQKVKSGNSTFGDDAVVNITASGALTAAATTTSGSEKIEITHNTTEVGAHTDYYGGGLNVIKIKNDTYGHITAVSYDTIATEGTYNSSSNKLMTKDATATAISTALGNLTTAMVYKGTSTGAVSSNAMNAPSGVSAGDLATGWVIVMAGDATIVPSEATSGAKTTLLGKQISSNGDTKLEKGDMLIYNGTNWNVVTAEGEVTDYTTAIEVPATTTASTASDVAMVDGTKITLSLKHATSGVTAGSYGQTANASPSAGTGTFKIPYITVNSAGHITSVADKTITLPADTNDNQKVKSGSNTFGDNATVNITASTGLTTSVTTTSGSEKIEIKHDTPSGAAATSSGFYKIATDSYGHVTGTDAVTASDITGLVTIPAAANNGTLTLKGQYTATNNTTADSNGVSLMTANQSGATGLTITGSNGIKTARITSSGVSTVTILHTNSVTQDTTGGFKKLKYDSQGHITGYENVTASDITGLVTIPTVNDAKLQLKVGTSGTAVDSGYTANAASAASLIFSDTASGAKFAVDSSTKIISITEIDGGTF